jgi:hypothetical protein
MRLQPRSATILVVIGAVILSTLLVRANDYLANRAETNEATTCTPGAVLVRLPDKTLCVDQYEASPAPNCAFLDPLTQRDTAVNVAQGCGMVSAPGLSPWRFVSQVEAKQICAQSGKRLLSPSEWYELALATQLISSCLDESGNGRTVPTGSRSCVTLHEIHDLVGNVWEWTDAVVVDGQYKGRQLPASGYIAALDGEGIVTEVSSSSSEQFGADYAWIASAGTVGVLRGGFFGSGTDGGVFAQNISTKTTDATPGIGFRCARELTL